MVRVLFSSDEKNPRKHYRFPQRKNTLFFDILSTGSHSPPVFTHAVVHRTPGKCCFAALCFVCWALGSDFFGARPQHRSTFHRNPSGSTCAHDSIYYDLKCSLRHRVFGTLEKRLFIAIGISSFLKFFFLFLVSTFLLGSFFESHILQNVVVMMSWPQLITAIIGGMIAFAVFRFVHKKQSPKN
jgi:hypothetical protein